MSDLPALATTSELAAWMQLDLADLPASASAVLDMASAIVRAEARQHFTRNTTTATLWPADGCVRLPQRPVISVVDVVGADAFRRLGPDGRLWVGTNEPVKVTYTHGYASTPGDVKAVVLTLAGRVLSNPGDVRQETVGSVSVTYASETIGASLAPADKDLLQRYRRRASVVSLR